MARKNYSLQALNTLGLSSVAAAYVEVHSETELLEAIRFAEASQLKILPIGEGSNVVLGQRVERLLLRDCRSGFQCIAEDPDTVTLRVAAGQNWHQLVAETLRRGWYGLENLALIPGAVGAAPIQNIGAYGVEASEFIQAVHGVYLPGDKEGNPGTLECWKLTREDCAFGYRDSVFKQQLKDRVLITAVDLRLSMHSSPRLDYPALKEALGAIYPDIKEADAQAVFDAVVAIRRSRLPDPAELPNVGSFFKNPVISQAQFSTLQHAFPALPGFPASDTGGQPATKVPAAWLIEHAGFKGRRRGALGMHSEQALVMVNYAARDPVHEREHEVTAADVLAYAKEIQEKVRELFGIALEVEPAVYT